MVDLQLRARGIRDERVLAAMGRVPREAFVDEISRAYAYDDGPLPIGAGQTISQPYMVALIAELAAVRAHDVVLDVGSGSGYQAAVIAELGATVHGIERIDELAERSRRVLAELGYGDGRVTVHTGDGSEGLPEFAPFDAITVAAAAPTVPIPLYEQLRERGRLIVPVGTRYEQWLTIVVRTPEGPAERRVVPCAFVPLIGHEGFGQ
jgi:protein-L-isoaspartate(D-aspartate) O-methyltransferase